MNRKEKKIKKNPTDIEHIINDTVYLEQICEPAAM